MSSTAGMFPRFFAQMALFSVSLASLLPSPIYMNIANTKHHHHRYGNYTSPTPFVSHRGILSKIHRFSRSHGHFEHASPVCVASQSLIQTNVLSPRCHPT